MVKPTFFQRVLGRPSQRYTLTDTITLTPPDGTSDYHSTKKELLRIAADLGNEISNDNQPTCHPHDPHCATSGEFLLVATSAAVTLPSFTSPSSPAASTGLPIDNSGDVSSAESRISGPQIQDRLSDDTNEAFFTPETSPATTTSSPPFQSPAQTPATTPSNSAASSTASLTDFVRSSTSLPDHMMLSTVNTIPVLPDTRRKRAPNCKLTYTDEDWAKDVRWLVAPQTEGTTAKHKGKTGKRLSAPPMPSVATSQSASSLSTSVYSSTSSTNFGRLSSAHPYTATSAHPPPRSGKPKGHSKAKISTARTVIGMSALLEVEEDVDPEPRSSDSIVNSDKALGRKRSLSSSYTRHQSPGNHEPQVSSPLRPHRLRRQRSASSPSLLLAGGETTDCPSSHLHGTRNTSHTELSAVSGPRRAFNAASRPLSAMSRITSSTSKSPYTSAAPNALDALAAHVSVSDSHDALPSSGTRGYTSLVLPRAATSPTLGIDQGTKRPWKLSKGRSAGATVRDSIGAGLGLGDHVDLTRPGLAQTTMASVEVVRGIAAGSGAIMNSSKSRGNLFGVSWFSKDKEKTLVRGKGKAPQDNMDTPLGFTAYRAPPVYVGGGSVLVQVWGVGLEGTDARLVGIHPPRPAGSPLPGAPYGTKAPKSSEKDKGRHAPVGYIPGRSFVGRVLEVGWEVGEGVAKRGDWVVGLMNVHKCGALAQFILADRHHVHRIPPPFMPSRSPFSLISSAGAADEVSSHEPSQRNSPMFPVPDEDLTINELALLPLCGVPAYRAVRTFHQITQTMGKPQLLYDNSHNEIHPIIPPRSDRQDFTAGEGQEGPTAQGRPCDSRPRALVLRAHDGPGAFAAQMLVHEGWSVWTHVPVPFMLPGPTPDVADDLKDEEEEKELEKRRSTLRCIEERLRGWGVDEVLFVPVTSMPLSALFEASNTAVDVMSSWSSPSIHVPRSSSSSPSISPSPFSMSTTSSPLSSPYTHIFSSGHFSSASPPSSSSHQNAFMTPYSFTPLPLAPYDCEQSSTVSLILYLNRSRVRLDAILDTIGGREIWEAGRSLLSRAVRDPSRQDVDAQFTTLIGDTPDRVVSTAGDNFRAGVRSLRIGSPKDQHPFEDSGYHETVTHGHGKEKKKSKLKPRPVNYSWVNVASDIDWEGSDVHDTLCAVLRMAASDGVKPVVAPVDLPNGAHRDKGKRRAVFGVEEELQGKVVPFEYTPDVFLPGGGLDHGGTIVSRIVG